MPRPSKNLTKFTRTRTCSLRTTHAIFPTTIYRTTIRLDAQQKIRSSTSGPWIWSYSSRLFFFFSTFLPVMTVTHSSPSISTSTYSYPYIAYCHGSTTMTMEKGIPRRRIPWRPTWRNVQKSHHRRDQLTLEVKSMIQQSSKRVMLQFFLSYLLDTCIDYLCRPSPSLFHITYALPPPSPYYMLHPLAQPSVTRITYVLLTPWCTSQ